jgi:probable F420-dependent oxidoreductase
MTSPDANLPLLGFGLPVSGSWATPDNVSTVARRAEQLGYHSLWTFQRLLHPATGDWGPMYRSVADPVISLGYAAALTTTIRLGVAVVNAPFFSPILLAKQFSTLDVLSKGRLDAGVGLGWAVEEFQASGVPIERRGARTEEFVECLKQIWTEDVVSFSGRFYQVPPSEVRPKPVQRPHPPILMGGGTDRALRRIGRIADGWVSSSRADLATIGAHVDTVKRAAGEAGRDPSGLRYVVRGVIALSETAGDDAAGRPGLRGTERQIRDDLERLAASGITEVFLDLNFNPDVGSPNADPAAAMRIAAQVLQTFATR